MAKAANNPYTWLDKLPELNSLLTAKGILVGADVWVRVYDLFIAQYQQQRLPKDPASLEAALSGLIATSAEQQQQFKAIYQQWLAEIGSETAANAKQAKKAKQENSLRR